MIFKKTFIFFLFMVSSLLFLNGICSAYPMSNITFQGNQVFTTHTIQNEAEPPVENAIQFHFSGNREFHVSLRRITSNRLFKTEANFFPFNSFYQKKEFPFVSYSHLLKPDYYGLLYLHSLF